MLDARRIVPHASLVALVAALALSPGAAAEPSWSWPERAENLQVLPKETTAAELRATMRGFVRGLGVRCVFCHVGEEGKPLATFDFASDENAKKKTARLMMRMVREVEGRLAAVEPSGPERIEIRCATCHHGVPRPADLETELLDAYAASGIDAALARYRELRERFYGRAAYDFGERSLNAVGYALLRRGDRDAALRVFTLNTEEHPDSGNVWDSLAETYAAAGGTEQAVVYYQKSLEVDPSNTNAAEKLRALRAPGASGTFLEKAP